ncbi:hypothetical protein LTR37_015968 [Vermiconidia calcicola]|uniref:Uncharacterized protein n=1 Tax=Vermiconidia calcicola TaxID=1690605 RepID=A0ACC3MP85_9PEZI|nr:hypothetical protein LTR37_015968 [Vermiconidia calcicola]
MDDRTIDIEIARLLSTADTYRRVITVLGVLPGALIAAFLLYVDYKRHTSCLFRLARCMVWASFYASFLARPLVVYLGIPKIFTFGIQIGKILPASCEASMAIEGPDGLPCSGKRFREWVRRFLSDNGSYHFDEIEGPWIGCAIIVAAFVLSMLLLAMPRTTDRSYEEHALAKAANDQEKQDLYASDFKAEI